MTEKDIAAALDEHLGRDASSSCVVSLSCCFCLIVCVCSFEPIFRYTLTQPQTHVL